MRLLRMKLSFFPPQDITSSAARPEMRRKSFFQNFYQKKGLILLLQDAAFEILRQVTEVKLGQVRSNSGWVTSEARPHNSPRRPSKGMLN